MDPYKYLGDISGNGSLDIKNIVPNWDTLTSDDFLVVFKSATFTNYNNGSATMWSKTYNVNPLNILYSDGIIKITNGYGSATGGSKQASSYNLILSIYIKP